MDAHDGKYLSIKRNVKEEGGGVEVRVAAQRYIDKCVTMESHWMRYNGMTERYDYLYVRAKKREEFLRACTLQTIETSTSSRDDPAFADATPQKTLSPKGSGAELPVLDKANESIEDPSPGRGY